MYKTVNIHCNDENHLKNIRCSKRATFLIIRSYFGLSLSCRKLATKLHSRCCSFYGRISYNNIMKCVRVNLYGVAAYIKHISKKKKHISVKPINNNNDSPVCDQGRKLNSIIILCLCYINKESTTKKITELTHVYMFWPSAAAAVLLYDNNTRVYSPPIYIILKNHWPQRVVIFFYDGDKKLYTHQSNRDRTR